MIQLHRAVPPHSLHKDISRGDEPMKEQKYDATYKFGKSTVHVVAPKLITEEEKEKILDDFHNAGWAILEKLEEQKVRLSG